MKKLAGLLVLVLFTAFSRSLPAQIPSGYVQATATVPALANGSFGAAWTNLSSSPQLGLLGCVSTFQTTVNGTIDSFGKFSVLVADPTQICPSPSTWTFTFSCHTPPAAFITQITISGGGNAEDITSQILAAAPSNLCQTGGGGLTVETNGSPNLSQTLLNFVNPSGFNGLNFIFSNPTGGNETFGLTGTLNNSGLTHSSTTVNGQPCVLGGSCTVTNPATTVFQHNGTNLPDQALLNFLDTPPSLPTNYVPVTFANDGAGGLGGYVPPANVAGGLQMAPPPPVAGQYVIIYPNPAPSTASFVFGPNCVFGQSANHNFGFSGALAAQAPWVNPANVTAVYAFGISSDPPGDPTGNACALPMYSVCMGVGLDASGTGSSSSPSLVPAGVDCWAGATEVKQMVGLTGANIDSVVIAMGGAISGDFLSPTSFAAGVGLFVYYTGSAPPASNKIIVNAPLQWDSVAQTLSISPWSVFLSDAIGPWGTIQTLPPATPYKNWTFRITNGANATDCNTGGGTNIVDCRSNGTIWVAESSGGGTTTNALTMNNGGSGAASGSTFDGSAAKTISYNTLGAQQALTLTTTGTSGAATLSTGTLNIPQYSGGGGSGTVSGQASGVIPLGTSATVIGNQSHLDDGVTAASTITSTEKIAAPSIATGTPSSGALAALPAGAHGLSCDESSTAGVPATGVDYVRCNSTTHQFVQSLNGAAESPFGGLASQAADTALMNATGGSAVPTAVAMPTCTTGADLYNTSTHAWSCVSTSGGSGAMTNITGTVTMTGCTVTSGNCVVTGSPASAITASVIPGTYIDLQISFFGTNSTSSNVNVNVTYNGDSGSNYDWNLLFGNSGTAASGASGTAVAFMLLCSAGQTGSFSGGGTIYIPQYSSTALFKVANGTCSGPSSGSHQATILTSGMWHNTAAITSITLTPSSGTFSVGDAFVIRGLN